MISAGSSAAGDESFWQIEGSELVEYRAVNFQQ